MHLAEMGRVPQRQPAGLICTRLCRAPADRSPVKEGCANRAYRTSLSHRMNLRVGSSSLLQYPIVTMDSHGIDTGVQTQDRGPNFSRSSFSTQSSPSSPQDGSDTGVQAQDRGIFVQTDIVRAVIVSAELQAVFIHTYTQHWAQ